MFEILFHPLFRTSRPRGRQIRLRSPWLLGLLLVAAIFLIYANSLHGAWIYDDYQDILANQPIQRFWPIRELFFTHVDGVLSTVARPLVNLSFALNFLAGQNDTFIFHLTNLGIHSLASLCLLDLLRRLLKRHPATARASLPLAFVTTFLWAIHPLQSEAVAYITQRYESMMALFVLLTLLCVTISTESRRPRLWWAAALSSCLMALASKEVAVSLPVLVLLFDRAFLGGSFKAAWEKRRALYLGFLPIWTLFYWNQHHVIGRQFAGFDLAVPWWQYAMNQPAVILHYLRLVFWPYPLVLDYFWQPSPTLAPLVPGFLVIGALAALTVHQLVRNSTWGFLGAFFFCILGPTSSIMPLLDLAVEHRMYLPLAAVLVAVVLGLHEGSRRLIRSHPEASGPLRSSALTASACTVALLGSLTFIRSDDYRSPLNIWLDTVIQRPDNPRAHSNYAHALQAVGLTDEAIRQIRIGVAQAPGNITIRGNLGAFLAFKGRYDEAIAELKTASRLDPEDPRPLMNLGMIYTRLKDYRIAEAYLRRAVELSPTFPNARFALGELYSTERDYPRALEQYRAASRLQPGFSIAHWGAARALLMQGHAPEAIHEFEEYIRLESNPGKAMITVGRSLITQGDPQDAYRYWRRAMALEPSNSAPKLMLAWSLSTYPRAEFRNGQEALALVNEVMNSGQGRTPAALEALGTSYAELGRYDDAAAATEDAIARLKTLSAKDLGPLETRLGLFRAGKPYREDPAEMPN